MKRNPSPLRYMPWMVRDAVNWPFRWFVLAAAALSAVVWRFSANMRVPKPGSVRFGSNTPEIANIAQLMQVGVWNTCLTVAILITLGALVGGDLERGYYRSWFSKPMSPVWYYVQRLLIGAVVIMLTPLVLGAGFALALNGSTGLTWDLVADIGLAYLLLAGATLLVSIFTSKGWLLVFVVSIFQGILGGLFTNRVPIPAWLLHLHQVLPPFDMVRPGSPMPHGADLWHVLLYGAGMLAAGLIVLRTRPLGNGISS